MPEYEIVMGGKVVNRLWENTHEQALSSFLNGMEPHGVKRLAPNLAVFLGEEEIHAQLVRPSKRREREATKAIREYDRSRMAGRYRG